MYSLTVIVKKAEKIPIEMVFFTKCIFVVNVSEWGVGG